MERARSSGRDRGTGGRAGERRKKRREREGREEDGEKDGRRETGLRAAVGRAARPRKTGEEFSDEGDSPSRRGLPLAAVNLLLLFFLSAPFSLSPALPFKVLFHLSFSFAAPNSGRENHPLFLRSSFFHLSFLYFPSDLQPSFFLSLSFFLVSSRCSLLEVAGFHFARSIFFPFSSERNARRVIAPRATIAVGIDAVLALGN